MKIQGTQRIDAIHAYRNKQEHRTGDKAKTSRKHDEVHISAEAKQLHGAQSMNETDRMQRINELKRSVSAGTYHVDAKQLAEKLLPILRDEDANGNG